MGIFGRRAGRAMMSGLSWCEERLVWCKSVVDVFWPALIIDNFLNTCVIQVFGDWHGA